MCGDVYGAVVLTVVCALCGAVSCCGVLSGSVWWCCRAMKYSLARMCCGVKLWCVVLLWWYVELWCAVLR